jgi:hypothetical protein
VRQRRGSSQARSMLTTLDHDGRDGEFIRVPHRVTSAAKAAHRQMEAMDPTSKPPSQ